MNIISIFLVAFLTENIVLTKFLGICPIIGTSNKEKNALGMGMVITPVILIASLITYLLYHYVLIPTETTYLKTIMFILVIASLVQMAELWLKKHNPNLYKNLGLYLPLITTNCAVLGVTLLNVTNDYNIINTLIFSLGSSLGFTAILYVFASIRERLERSDVNKYFQGVPIALITLAIMALLFSRYILK